MKVVLNEIKKIFNIKMISLVIIGSFMMYYIFISFYIDYFPNGRPESDFYNISVKMIEDYGNNMDSSEFNNFKGIHAEKIKKANKYLTSKEEFVKVGITTYSAFEDIDVYDEELYNLIKKVMFEEQVDVFWELQAMDWLVYKYENSEEKVSKSSLNTNYEGRNKQLKQNNNNNDILPYFVFNNFNDSVQYVIALILLSVIFMTIPIFLRDKRNKVEYIQYTSKTGRNLYKKKIAAALISAFMITATQMGAFLIIYSTNNVSMYFKSSINSIFNKLFWFDLSFMQYIYVIVICTFILSFVVSLITAFVSSKVSNYMAAIGLQIPIYAGLIFLVQRYIINDLTVIYKGKALTFICYLTLIIISTVLVVLRWKKERAIEI
ncbi:hypothetical protein [Abyssisolibacter fermentans]|uniref:hypothetical protein n=1 Tax=Abyssisolibacter fermentans TaxID=1766203 RepID=UPI00083377EB|nr:hypothetical protein [Abyssisolibacter fermentans]